MTMKKLFRNAALTLAIGACLALAAQARPGHGGAAASQAPTGSAPVLQDVSVPFGQYTYVTHGSVRLDSKDDITQPFVVKGLDLLTPNSPACATWTVTLASGTATHFLMASNAPNATARTPSVNTPGMNAHLNGGPYIFNVNCLGTDGQQSNTAHLTYSIVANAANEGDDWGNNFPAVTAGYANFASTAGYQILLSVGYKRTTNVGWSIACPVQCGITWADAARPGLASGFSPHYGSEQLLIHDMNLTMPGGGTHLYFLGNGQPNRVSISNVHVMDTPFVGANYLPQCFHSDWDGTGQTIDNLECDWVGVGVQLMSGGYTFHNLTVNHFTAGGVDFSNVENLAMFDTLLIAPEVGVGGNHADCWQLENGTSQNNWDIERAICVQAGGYGQAQGIPFAGHFSRGGVYMDDGTTSHGPGHRVTFVPPLGDPHTFFSPGSQNAAGSRFFMPGYIEGSANAHIISSNGYNYGDLSGVTDAVIGSPDAPVDGGTWSGENYSFKEILVTGNTYNGGGTNSEHGVGGWQNFAYFPQDPDTAYATMANVDVSGTTLTVHGPTTSNALYNIGITPGITSIGSYISYPGGSGTTIISKQSGSQWCNLPTDTICTYTLAAASGDVTNAPAQMIPPVGIIPLASNMRFAQQQVDLAYLHTGTQTFANGYVNSFYSWNTSFGTYALSPPPNSTWSHVYTLTSAPLATSWANGNPRDAFMAISIPDWNAKTIPQILATYCHYLLPAIGGPLDNGDGTFASPFKLSGGVGEWADGTPIAGCS